MGEEVSEFQTARGCQFYRKVKVFLQMQQKKSVGASTPTLFLVKRKPLQPCFHKIAQIGDRAEITHIKITIFYHDAEGLF